MRPLRAAFLVSVWFATTAATCNFGEDPSPGTEGPQGTLPDGGAAALCTDPCDGDQVLYGPETFTRECSSPDWNVRSFQVPADADACIVVTNDGNSSAKIKIDGAQLIGPNEFNPHVTRVTASVNLAAGEHELKVRVDSGPGTGITVEIRACDDGTPPQLPCSQVAEQWCLDMGWDVSLTMPGGLICTMPGKDYNDNCATCEDYNLLVWSDGTGDPVCPRVYDTNAGDVYGGHEPCACTNDLLVCGVWELEGCIPD